MTKRRQPPDIAQLRLRSQQIARSAFRSPADVVGWFGAVQAQEYRESLWGVGLRTRNARQQDVEDAANRGEIVRTWPMRGTLHFVAPADVRWMLQHLTPRVVAAATSRYRALELDEAVFARAARVCVAVLEGGRQLARRDLYAALGAAGIRTAAGRGLHIVSHLAQRGLLCFGPRRGAQPTLALLEEWVPEAPPLTRDEALAELALRYNPWNRRDDPHRSVCTDSVQRAPGHRGGARRHAAFLGTPVDVA
jgi:hypothetical protein